MVEDYLRQGFRKLLVLNGHFENTPYVFEALEALEVRGAGPKFVLVNWWEQIGSDDLARVFPDGFPGWEAEHAGIAETSLMEALVGSKVRTGLKTDSPPLRRLSYDVLPPPSDVVPPTGVPYRSTPASAQIGDILVDVIVERVLRIVSEEFDR